MYDTLRALLQSIGEDPHREGLKNTPRCWEEALKFLTSGYQENLVTVVNGALYPVKPSPREGHGASPVEDSGLVLVRDIEFYSLCEHHLLPFFGRAHIGYLPGKSVIGLSKIPRIVNMYARRLQTQERLGQQVMRALEEVLKPRGIGVVIEAEHLCMKMRGVEKERARVVTNHFQGLLSRDTGKQKGFLMLLKGP